MPENIVEAFTRQDRDTIIRLDEKQGSLLSTVNRIEAVVTDLKNNTVARIERLEQDRASKAELEALKKQAEQLVLSKANHSDIEALGKRTAALEDFKTSWKTAVAIFILVSGIFVTLVTYIYFSDINQIKTELQKHVEQTGGGASK